MEDIRLANGTIELTVVCVACKKHLIVHSLEERCQQCNSLVRLAASDNAIIGELSAAYDVYEKLGTGASGTVHRARQRSINRAVAIKILHRHLAGDPLKVARFMDEARSLRELHHENIAAVYDCGTASSGQPYLVEEYVPGESLQSLIQRRYKFTGVQFKEIFAAILDALSHAHSKSIVHRDIKPANIIISDLENHPRVKLLDFGVAKLSEEDNNRGSLTATGELLGTPLYMSPEQCSGQELDGRADLYSVACVMYEVLCGRLPFIADTPFDCMMKHLREEPSAPESFGISPAYSAVVMLALRKQREDRYLSAADFKKDITSLGSMVSLPGKQTVLPGIILISLCLLTVLFLFLSRDQKPVAVETTPGAPSKVVPSTVPVDTSVHDTPASPERPVPEENREIAVTFKDELEQRINDIQHGISWLKTNGSAARAASLEKQLNAFKSEVSNSNYRPVATEEPELHAIGIKVGREPNAFNHKGIVDIHVSYTAGPVVLAINSSNDSELICNFKLDQGVHITKILLCGDEADVIKMNGVSQVPVEKISAHSAYEKNLFGLPEFQEQVPSATGLQMASFLPDTAGAPYELGSHNDDWRYQEIAFRMTPLWNEATTDERHYYEQKLANVRFYDAAPRAPQKDSSNVSEDQSLYQFDIDGPIRKTEKKLEGMFTDIDYSPQLNKCFVVNNALFNLNLASMRTTKVGLTPELATCSVDRTSMDSSGKILWIENFRLEIMKYDIEHDRVEFFTCAPVRSAGFAYSDKEKAFYTVNWTNALPGHVRTLYKYDMKGTLIWKKNLDKPFWVAGNGSMQGVKLVSVGEYLIALSNVNANGVPANPMLHVIDPATGRILLSRKTKLH